MPEFGNAKFPGDHRCVVFARSQSLTALVGNDCSSNGSGATPSSLPLPEVVATPNGAGLVIVVAHKAVGGLSRFTY